MKNLNTCLGLWPLSPWILQPCISQNQQNHCPLRLQPTKRSILVKVASSRKKSSSNIIPDDEEIKISPASSYPFRLDISLDIYSRRFWVTLYPCFCITASYTKPAKAITRVEDVLTSSSPLASNYNTHSIRKQHYNKRTNNSPNHLGGLPIKLFPTQTSCFRSQGY